MVRASKDDFVRMGMEHVRYASEEIERRKKSKVHVSGDDIQEMLKEHTHPYIVDPRLGFNQRWFRFWINRGSVGMEDPGRTEGYGLGHRHTVEAVIYIMQGHGFSLIDGVKHPWEAGDFICVPVFAWHKHFNESKDTELWHMAVTTGPFGMATGIAIYEDEKYPEYWIYAKKGEEAMKSLIPGEGEEPGGGRINFDPSKWKPEPRKQGEPIRPEDLYYEQLAYAQEEEKRRRASKVVQHWKDLVWGPTPMGRMAYVVDPRIGFHVKLLSTTVAEVPAGKRSGAHRHIYEETNYVMQGEGYVIVDDQRYDFKQGDVLVIPVFAWHQYFNTGNETARFISHTNRVAMESTGFVHTQQGESANY